MKIKSKLFFLIEYLILRYLKNMNVKDIDILEYIKNHSITQARDYFGVGLYGINRIISEMEGSKKV